MHPVPIARPARAAKRALALRTGRLAALTVGLYGVCACTALATTPDWTGGGLALEAPLRMAEVEAAEERERQRIASEPKKVRARHLLVMHEASESKPEGVTRTRVEARARAVECLLKIRGGAEFEDVVAECSDEPGAAERGGDLGEFTRDRMVKSFADAAFSLKVGEVSELVETPFGFHVIQRTE